VKVAPGANVETVRAEIKRRLPFNDVYTQSEWATRSRSYWVESTGLGLNMYLTVFLGCLVGIVVVAQTLYTSTMEHIKEFGTVKAIGGGNADIYKILGKQATIAAIAGFFLGALMAYAIRPLIYKIDLKLVIPNELAIAVFFGAIALCLAASMISFRKVASIDPALVFRG
jgi:putative ABC transport system permease protein